jgi:hypothetical protein
LIVGTLELKSGERWLAAFFWSSLFSLALLARNRLPIVIPAKAGIHFAMRLFASAVSSSSKAESKWIPAFAGMTNGDWRRRQVPVFA